MTIDKNTTILEVVVFIENSGVPYQVLDATPGITIQDLAKKWLERWREVGDVVETKWL